jgi:3-hydroxyacyl-CoA dehydrogenase
MTREIRTVTVLGAGAMGSTIAAHLANAGIKVHLLDDYVPAGAADRAAFPRSQIAKLAQGKGAGAGFMSPSNAKLVIPGNMNDDLESAVKDSDWIIEAIKEDVDWKRSWFAKIDAVKKPGAIVSSNTSTIPLHDLAAGRSDDFRRNFLITHFFNPPRYMRLLEIINGKETSAEATAAVSDFSDRKLGKNVVVCNDTPGFIANRIGTFFMIRAVQEAMEKGIKIEDIDAVLGKPLGFPKDGIFGLMDMVGLGLMPHVVGSLEAKLDPRDAFIAVDKKPAMDFLQTLIKSGRTGRSSDKGGFYLMKKAEDGGKQLTVIDPKTGEYHNVEKKKLPAVEAGKKGPRAVFGVHDDLSDYAWRVLRDTLLYTASLVPEISDNIADIDAAMRDGYNWTKGPFELIDQLGPEWFAARVKKDGLELPPALKLAAGRPFYSTEGGKLSHLNFDFAGKKADYASDAPKDGVLRLSDVKLNSKPLIKNDSASLWDIGDGVLCVEFHSKMNTMDPSILHLLNESVKKLNSEDQWKSLVIYNDDPKAFSAGANLGLVSKEFELAQAPFTMLNNMLTFKTLRSMFVPKKAAAALTKAVASVAKRLDKVARPFIGKAIEKHAYNSTNDLVHFGQAVYSAMRYSAKPIIGAPAQMALGGGCEILLNCSGVQAHAELYQGLVESGVGVLPAWTGCTRMLERVQQNTGSKVIAFEHIKPLFMGLMMPPQFISTSAQDAKKKMWMRPTDGISMNRDRVLFDAKQRGLTMAPGYMPPKPAEYYLPGPSARAAFQMGVESLYISGGPDPKTPVTYQDVRIADAIGAVLTGGDTFAAKKLSEDDLLHLERENFMSLLHTPETRNRVATLISGGEPKRENPSYIDKTPAQLRAERVVESLPRLPITGKPLEGDEAAKLQKMAQNTAWMMRKFG